MYSIYADDVCIYNDVFLLDDMKVVEPKLVLEDSAAGSFTFTLPPSNIGYKTITRMITDISVRKDNEEIWAGRVLSESMDFWNNRVLTCEGELAFFNDTTQPPAEYHNLTVRGFLETLVQIHNSKVAANRRFTVGAVTVKDPNDSIYRYTNSEKTIDCINEKLVERLGGHIRVRKANGVRYLDYLEDYPSTNTQTIEFGKNLLDFTRNWDMSEFATVIVPRGARLEESPIEALEAYLTVESVNNGSIYVQSAPAVASYGWIEKVVDWDDVTTPSALLTKAKKYLAEIQFENMTLELSALDLHYQNVSYEAVKLLDLVEVISRPHGMDRTFPVKKLEIPLDRPEDTKFTLGDTIRTTLTSVNNAINSQILREIEKIPSGSAILKEAVANATAIMNMAVNGYVTIARNQYGAEALYVSDNRDYTKATRLWKWNLNGLAYSKDGGKTWGMAMTMDGRIVADFITVGTMLADRLRGGTLTLGGGNNGNGVLQILNAAGENIGRIDNTGAYFNDGSFSGSIILKTAKIDPEGRFESWCEHSWGGHSSLIIDTAHMDMTTNDNLRFRLENYQHGVVMSMYDDNPNSVFFDVSAPERKVLINGAFMVNGTKSRVVDTLNYERRSLYCYEMPAPMFGDTGEAMIDECGDCYIYLDGVFSETVNTDIEYQVFLQKENEGNLWVQKKAPLYFHVKGSPEIKFSWEIKAKQKGYEYERLESTFHLSKGILPDHEADYGTSLESFRNSILGREEKYIKEINQLINEREGFYNETAQWFYGI